MGPNDERGRLLREIYCWVEGRGVAAPAHSEGRTSSRRFGLAESGGT